MWINQFKDLFIKRFDSSQTSTKCAQTIPNKSQIKIYPEHLNAININLNQSS